MEFFSKQRIPRLLIGVLFVFSATILFYNLGSEPFQDYDETTYAEVTSESIARGNYLSLTFLNNDYFRKPPLLFWLTSAADQAFTDTEFAMRFPSALAALLLIPLVILICVEAGTGLRVGILAGIVLATTSAAMEPARQVRFDVLISFFIAAAFYAAIRAERSRKWYLVMGACVGFAVLTKSVIAVFAPIAILIYLYQRQKLNFFFDRWFWGGVGMFVLVAAPWHIYQSIQFGTAFWQSYLGSQVLERATTNLFTGTNSPTNADYFRYVAGFAAPWSLLFCAAVLSAPLYWKRKEANTRAVWLASLGTVFSVFGLMLLSSTKAVTYLIPMYPFISIVVALSVHGLWKQYGRNMRAVLLAVLLVSTLAAGYVCVWNVFHLNPYYSVQYQLAQEEHAITQTILERTDTPLIYTYKNDNLGSIQYYTRLPFTKHPFVYLLEGATSTPPAFLVTPVSQEELEVQFPQFSFEPLYTGSLLSLFSVAS